MADRALLAAQNPTWAKANDEPITRVIKLTAKAWGVHPYDINNGDCEEFAEEVAAAVPNAVAMWGDEIGNRFGDEFDADYHKFVEFKGRFYDAEEPYGVDDPRKLPFFLRQLAVRHIKPLEVR